MLSRFSMLVALVAASFTLASAPTAHAFPIGDQVRPDLDDTVFDPTPDRGDDLVCFAKKTSAGAKLARKLVRCNRLEKTRAPADFSRRGCEKKALRRYVAKTTRGTCGTIGGGGGGGTTAKFTCEGLLCSCTGTVDCDDMFTTAGCGDVASCDTSGPEDKCSCLKSLG